MQVITSVPATIWGDLLMDEVTAFILELARIVGLVVTSPLPWEAAPRQAKTAIVILLALVAHGAPMAEGFRTGDLLSLALATVLEFGTGVAMGFVVRMTVGIAEVAGSTVGPIIGFGAAQMFDPMTGQSDTILVRMFRSLALLIGLAIGAHRHIIGGVLLSFHRVPVGSVLNPGLAAPYLLTLSGELLEIGVRLALPIIAVLLLLQIALAFVSRAAPAMQVFSIGFVVLFLAGGFVMVLALPDTGFEFAEAWERTGYQMERVLMEISSP
jgi:flagellar biosynthetic protein FliR